MTKYLILFITDGEFATYIEHADTILKALNQFEEGPMQYQEIYAISRVVQ